MRTIGAGLRAQQDVKRIERLIERDLKDRNGALHLGEHAFGLSQLQFGGCSLAVLEPDRIDEPLLRGHLLVGDGQAFLKPANQDVGVGDLSRDRQPGCRHVHARC